ncbi:MAG: ShlB/FhaC/HecB family hemolysin secretion/activation protein [bacterium]|nr:ShlB/FhaC/HecB family hemolysin secretion/activation protein [bacterium]
MSWLPEFPSPTRTASARFAGALVIVFLLSSSLSASGQVLLLPEDEGPKTFRIGELELEYARERTSEPALDEITPITVELRRTEVGWDAPREDEPGERVEVGGPKSPVLDLEVGGLVRVLGRLVARLNEAGLSGVDVRPSARDFDLENERDLRPPDRENLTIVISAGRISRIRTIAVGDRVKGDWKIDNEVHTRIRESSPLQPAELEDEDSTDLVDRHALERYLFRLNRHSGRRVEAALSPGEDPGDVVLDYRVLESKPWYAYAQVTDTGTRRTNPWQTRLGYTHRQLTNRDDVLSVDWLNVSLDEVNAVSARYQAPFFGKERPAWMSQRRGDPEWIEWLPRDEIPWWGIERLRWEVNFAMSKSQAGRSATQVGLANDRITSAQYQAGGRFIYEAFQLRNLFIDFYGGLSFRDLDVNNRTVDAGGDALLVIPRIGVHSERISQISNFQLDLSANGQINQIDSGNLDALGRDEADEKYAIVNFNLGYSTFLEPLLRPEAWRDPSTHSSSTLAHEISFGIRGQYAFDYRLIPQSNGSIGGLYSVRGYSQSVAVGDTIAIASAEYRFHFPRALPVLRQPLRLPLIGDFRAAPQQVYGRPDWDLVLRAFVDAGHAVRNDQHRVSVGATEDDQTLIGAGVGADLQIRSNLRARIDWATALMNTNGDIANGANVGQSELHVLFSILY